MTIDLKWLLPFTLPFALLFTSKALWWVADAEIADPSSLAGSCLIVGFLLGTFIVGALAVEGIKWNVKIGSNE